MKPALRARLWYYKIQCVCCGETEIKFLTLDHKNNDGYIHRKKMNTDVIHWVKRNNFPDIFQTLCWNCNLAKVHNKGICPHMQKKSNSFVITKTWIIGK